MYCFYTPSEYVSINEPDKDTGLCYCFFESDGDEIEAPYYYSMWIKPDDLLKLPGFNVEDAYCQSIISDEIFIKWCFENDKIDLLSDYFVLEDGKVI